jgi:hypothetical protein
MANRRFIDFPIASTVGDNDIVLIWQDGLNKQTTKGTLIQGAPTSLEGLTDVDIAGLINGQILQYNSVTGKWENVDRTGLNLSELGDVSIVSPSNGQVLVYNSSTSKWENSSAGFVPYTGAVTTVNLGAQTIQAGSFVKQGGTSAQFLKANGSVDSNTYLTTGSAAATYVPYTGATADVNLGTHDLTAERGTFANNGSSDTLTVNHTSGSGYGINVTKGGNNEALLVTKTSGSGNAMAVVGGRTALVDLSLSSVSNATGNFLTISGGVVHQRTPSETRSDVGAQAQLNGTGFVKASGTTISYDNSTYQVTSEKAQPNGYASLDSNGKVPLVQINDALIGNVNFQGLWNASTNTPTLANPPASGTKGYYYIVSTAGTFAGISFEVGDWIISDGTAWGKVDNTDAVSSVFGRTGNVVASNGDYTTAQVTESGNLYYTDGRARGAISLTTTGASGSSTYNNTTGVLNVPAYTLSGLGGIGGTIASGQVAFGTAANTIGGDNGLFWDNINKRLGINKSNPQTNLDVLGSTGIYQRDSSGGSIVFDDSDTADASTPMSFIRNTSGALQFGRSNRNASTGITTNSVESWRMTNTGILQSNGAQTIQTSTGNLTLATAAGNGNILLTPNGTGNVLLIPITGGRVGIGQEIPAYRLDVGVSGVAGIIDIARFAANGNGGVGRGTGILIGAAGSANSVQVARLVGYQETTSATANNAAFAIQVANSSATLTQYLKIFNTGNVVIQNGGTFTDAGFKLDVNGTARVQGNLNVSTGGITLTGAQTIQTSTGNLTLATAGGNGNILLTPNGTGNVTISKSNTGFTTSIDNQGTASGSSGLLITAGAVSGDNILLVRQRSGTEIFAVKGDGNVLINTTTNAGFRLDVNGTARVQGALSIIGNIDVLAGGVGSSFNRQISLGSGTAYNYQVRANDDDFQLREAGSHVFLAYTYGGSLGTGTIRLYNNTVSTASFTGTSFIKSGGTSSQFLKADGSVDSNTYVTGGPFLPLTGGTLTGALNGTTASFSSSLQTAGDISLIPVSGDININMKNSSGNATRVLTRQISTNNVFIGDIDSTGGKAIIRANGQDYLIVDINGNVGIGTSSPAYPLDIQSTSGALGISLRGRASDNISLFTFFNNAANTQLAKFTAASTYLGIDVGGSERMKITSGGKVSINTTLAEGILNIDTKSSATYNPNSYNGNLSNIYLTNGSIGSGRFSGINFAGGGSTEGFFGVVQNASTLAEFVFQTYNGSAYGERVRISSGGNFTINTLAGSGNRIVLANSGGTLISAVIGSGLAFDGTTLTATGGSSGSISGSGTSGTIALFTGGASIGNSIITQTSDNSIQIATNSSAPSTNNTIYSFSSNGFFYIQGGSVGLALAGSGNRSNAIYVRSSDNSIEFHTNNAGQRMRIASTGNVLINTTSDNGNRLRVNGTIFSDSSVTATSFFESSDSKIKTLVEDAYQAKGIDSVVAKLYIKNGKQELGYYAQDLEGVLPSAVSKGSNGLLNLSYREVHTAKIAYLEQRIKQLENELLKPS